MLGAYAFAFGTGMVTFLAPCAYPMLPGYVAYYLGDGDGERDLAGRGRRALTVAAITSSGFVLVYAVLAGIASALGSRVLQNVAVLELVVGGLLVALGVAMLSGRFVPQAHLQLPERERSVRGYFAFGVIYAAAAAGCTAPAFLAVVAVALGSSPVGAVGVFAAYAAGMSLLMVLVTGLAAVGRTTVLARLSGASGRLQQVAGGVMVIAGLVQVYFFVFRFDGLALLGL